MGIGDQASRGRRCGRDRVANSLKGSGGIGIAAAKAVIYTLAAGVECVFRHLPQVPGFRD